MVFDNNNLIFGYGKVVFGNDKVNFDYGEVVLGHDHDKVVVDKQDFGHGNLTFGCTWTETCNKLYSIVVTKEAVLKNNQVSFRSTTK